MADKDETDKARFEPPPWEREAFEALAARRAEEKAAREVLEAAAVRSAAKEPDPWAEEPDAPKSAPAPAADGEAPVSTPEVAATGRPVRPDDRAVEAMLVQLKGEERTDGTTTILIGRIASGLVLVIGLAMVAAGIAMVGRGGSTTVTVMGSAVLSIFGLSFAGMAVWVWVTTSRSRGR